MGYTGGRPRPLRPRPDATPVVAPVATPYDPVAETPRPSGVTAADAPGPETPARQDVNARAVAGPASETPDERPGVLGLGLAGRMVGTPRTGRPAADTAAHPVVEGVSTMVARVAKTVRTPPPQTQGVPDRPGPSRPAVEVRDRPADVGAKVVTFRRPPFLAGPRRGRPRPLVDTDAETPRTPGLTAAGRTGRRPKATVSAGPALGRPFDRALVVEVVVKVAAAPPGPRRATDPDGGVADAGERRAVGLTASRPAGPA